MRYTNLEDSDENKIFEGDILEDHFWNGVWFTVKRVVRIPDIYEILDSHKIKRDSYYKIIGNIYKRKDYWVYFAGRVFGQLFESGF